MVEPDNIEDLLAKFIIVGGPIASLICAFIYGDDRREFTAILLVGCALSGATWAKFRWFTR